jgi:hypothetical protein
MSKMGLHCSFGHLKHKLWAKDGSGVNLSVWLPTTKSRESTRFTCQQRKCHIPLESSQWELQLCFRLHLDQRFARKVMRFQSCGSPNLGDFGTPTWESRDKNVHLDVGPMDKHIVYYKGEDGGFPQVRVMVSLACSCCPWFILAPKVLQLCTNRLVWVLCRLVWVNEACQLFLVPSQNSSTPLYPSKCYEPKSMSWLLFFSLFFTWIHIWVPQRVGSASIMPCHENIWIFFEKF